MAANNEGTIIKQIKTSDGKTHLINATQWNGTTSLKNINGVNIKGSGDVNITYQLNDDIVVDSNGNSTATIQPNIFYLWGEVKTLNLTFGSPTFTNLANEYIFQFTSGTTATTLQLPAGIKWPYGASGPDIQINRIYQISIINNLATIVWWNKN